MAALGYGAANVAQQVANGEISRFRDRVRAFGSGALAGGLLAAGVVTVRHISLGRKVLRGVATAHGTALAAGLVGGLGRGLGHRDGRVWVHAWQILVGNFYLDAHRSLFGQAWQGISRFSWELPQATAGHAYAQWRNALGGVDKVKRLGGATFSIGTGRRVRHGVSMAPHIGLSLHTDDVALPYHPLSMHEYGHTFQSRGWGPLYLLVVGLPSLLSAATARPIGGGLTSHSLRWYERQANRYAARYVAAHYGVDWARYAPPRGGFPT